MNPWQHCMLSEHLDQPTTVHETRLERVKSSHLREKVRCRSHEGQEWAPGAPWGISVLQLDVHHCSRTPGSPSPGADRASPQGGPTAWTQRICRVMIGHISSLYHAAAPGIDSDSPTVVGAGDRGRPAPCGGVWSSCPGNTTFQIVGVTSPTYGHVTTSVTLP